MAPRPHNLPENHTSPASVHPDARSGRGAVSNTSGRFETEYRVTRDEDFAFDDGWDGGAEALPTSTTIVRHTSRTILARNALPDILFVRSTNPYRGCEH